MLTHVATSLHTYRRDDRIRWLPVMHYGKEPIFLHGYLGGSHDLGTVRQLIDRHGTRETIPTNQSGSSDEGQSG